MSSARIGEFANVTSPEPWQPGKGKRDGGPPDVGVTRAQRAQVRLGRQRVVGRLEAHDCRQADLGRLGVEGGGEPGQRLVVARRERLQRLHGQPADVGLLGLQCQVDRPEVGLAQVAAQAVEGGHADRLVAEHQAILQERHGARPF